MAFMAMFISANGFKSGKHRFLPACCGSFALACLLQVAAFVSCKSATGASDPVVERVQKALFEAWLRRELRGDELRKLTDEFIAYHSKLGKDRAGIHEATKPFLEYAKILRERNGTPMAFSLRHSLLEANYFSPLLQNSTIVRLLNEPDPVRVVDAGGKHLMTESEVVALAELAHFSNSNGEPQHREFSRQSINNLAVELNRLFTNHAQGGQMPRFYWETAALWAGIRREWPNLNADQKRQVRVYAAKCGMVPLNDYKIYSQLLGINMYDAFDHWNHDSTMAYLRVMGMYLSTMAIINATPIQKY